MPPLLTSFSTLVLLLTMLPQTFLLPTASAASSSFTPTIDGDAEVLNRLFLSLSMEPLHTSWEVNDRKRKSKNKNKRGQQQQQQEEGALPPTVKWTEGPVPLWDGRLMFSDTILAKIFIWSPRGFLEEFLTNAGDAPKGDETAAAGDADQEDTPPAEVGPPATDAAGVEAPPAEAAALTPMVADGECP